MFLSALHFAYRLRRSLPPRWLSLAIACHPVAGFPRPVRWGPDWAKSIERSAILVVHYDGAPITWA